MILLAVTALAYLPAIQKTFISDDYVWIEPLSRNQILPLFTGSWEHGNTLRPIMRLQFFVDRVIFGERAIFWHLTNLFLHALVSWCCYRLIRAIGGSRLLAVTGALIFALFPTNHEVVAWVSGRTHSFGLLLSLAAGLLLYKGATIEKNYCYYLTSGYLILLAAFLTYEISFVVPVALLAALLLFTSPTRRAWLTILASFGLLAGLIVYRFLVLGGTVGSVSRQYDNIFLAPFYNLPALKMFYWHSTDLKITLSLLTLLLVIIPIRQKFWKGQSQALTHAVYFIILTILTYLPFSVVKGVAPRFLYSSLFFLTLAGSAAYIYAAPLVAKARARFLFPALAILILLFSAIHTRELANKYGVVTHTYEIIIAQVKRDFPEWPEGQDMIFFGLPNTNREVVAFITYFDKALGRAYPKMTGRVYRSQDLTAEELKLRLTSKQNIIYDFTGFGKGVKKR